MSDTPRAPRHDEPTEPPARPSTPEREAPACNPTTCPICGAPLVGVHCKLMCENCGYREDCSDLFPG